LSRIRETAGRQRLAALQEQDISHVHSITQYVERMRRSLRDAERRLGERMQELQQAVERDTLAEKDVIAARLEKKRIMKLIEGRNIEELVKGSAVEESLTDEMSTAARKR
jgi:hypothetical protein